jgi:hypothetical protein
MQQNPSLPDGAPLQYRALRVVLDEESPDLTRPGTEPSGVAFSDASAPRRSLPTASPRLPMQEGHAPACLVVGARSWTCRTC